MSTVNVAYDDRDHPEWFLDWGLSGSPHEKLQLAQWLERSGAPLLAGKVRDAVEREQHESFARISDRHSNWRETDRLRPAGVPRPAAAGGVGRPGVRAHVPAVPHEVRRRTS